MEEKGEDYSWIYPISPAMSYTPISPPTSDVAYEETFSPHKYFSVLSVGPQMEEEEEESTQKEQSSSSSSSSSTSTSLGEIINQQMKGSFAKYNLKRLLVKANQTIADNMAGIPKIIHADEYPIPLLLQYDDAVPMEPGTSFFSPCLPGTTSSCDSVKHIDKLLPYLSGKKLWCTTPADVLHANNLIEAYRSAVAKGKWVTTLVNAQLADDVDFIFGREIVSPHICAQKRTFEHFLEKNKN